MLKTISSDNGITKHRPLTVAQALEQLCEVRAIPVKVRGKTVWVRTDIAGNAATLFKAAGIKIPPKILDPPSQICSGTK